MVTSINTYAQDPQLYENDWYLQKVVIDGEDIFPPYPVDEPQRGRANFSEGAFKEVSVSFCGGLLFSVQTIDSSVFYLEDSPTILLMSCLIEENSTFEHNYYSVFYNQSTDSAKNPFNYTLFIVDDVTTLIITNGDGDIAVFGNEFLSSQDFINASVSIYPNPVKNTLQISSENNITIKAVEVYDVLGKRLLQTNGMKQIDVSNLATGMLFLKITTDKGVLVKKIVKV